MREGPDRLQTIIARQVGAPATGDAIRLLQNRLRLPVSEISRIGDAERQQIGRIRVQDFAPSGESPIERTLGAGRRGCHMQPLPRRRRPRPSLGNGKRMSDLRPARRVGGRQQQIGPQGMGHQEIRIGRQCFGHQPHRVGVVFQVVLNRCIEGSHRGCAIRRERQPAYVALHLQRAVPAQILDGSVIHP